MQAWFPCLEESVAGENMKVASADCSLKELDSVRKGRE